MELSNNQNRPIEEHKLRPEKILTYLVFFILIFGLVSLSSASSIDSYNKFGDPYWTVKHQIPYALIGAVLFFFFANRDYRGLKKYAVHFLLGSIFLLTLVFIPGLRAEHGTSRSWIIIFGQSVQPAEFVKFALLFYLAAWFEANRKKTKDGVREHFGPFLAILGLVAILMLLQPDVGTLFIILIISLLAYFVGGGSIRHILYVGLAGIVGLSMLLAIKAYEPGKGFSVDNSYQLKRFYCAIDPSWDTKDACYQVNQSLIAVGSGGFWGRGIGQSRQKFLYIPEVSNDFIFAIIAEEIGMFGSAILVSAYMYLFYIGIKIAEKAPDDFGKISAVGIVGWVAVQAFINIGGITNIIPMTGVPLPLVSAGGSAMITAMAALGVLASIGKYSRAR